MTAHATVCSVDETADLSHAVTIGEPSLPFIEEFIYDLIVNWQHIWSTLVRPDHRKSKRPRRIPRPLRRTKPALG